MISIDPLIVETYSDHPISFIESNDYRSRRARDLADNEFLGGIVSALKTVLPVGLFLASVEPNILTVSTGRHRRSGPDHEVGDQVTYPILDMIGAYGMRALQDPSCQSKIVCEMGRMGGLPNANQVQRALWITAN